MNKGRLPPVIHLLARREPNDISVFPLARSMVNDHRDLTFTKERRSLSDFPGPAPGLVRSFERAARETRDQSACTTRQRSNPLPGCPRLHHVVYLYLCPWFEYARESTTSQEAKAATV